MHSTTPTQEMREEIALKLAPLRGIPRDLRIGIMLHKAQTKRRTSDIASAPGSLLNAQIEFLLELSENPNLIDAHLPEEDNDPDSLYATRGTGITVLSTCKPVDV